MQQDTNVFVRKTGGVNRNLERYRALSRLNLPTPRILAIYDDSYDMEYIQHEDIKTYLTKNSIKYLYSFITMVLDKMSFQTIAKDYTRIYEQKLSIFPWEKYNLPFTADELHDKLPKILPSSEYHGDFTLENILFRINNGFILIDPLTTEYDSYVFDLAKLMQDIKCKWFIRNGDYYLDSKLNILENLCKNYTHYNDYLLILMLMRVLPYTNSDDTYFIEGEIKKLWK